MAFMRRLNCSLLYLLTSTAYLGTTNNGLCRGGTWGEMCKEQCPPGCAAFRGVVHCHKLDGECSEGCISGLYGYTCAASCSTGCLGGYCHMHNGKCVQCKEGCFGPDCGNCSSQKTPSTAVQIAPTAPFPPRHACSSGTWGDKCDKPCPTHCIQYAGRSCNETTGVCLTGCLRGFYGERCDKLCSRSCEDSVCQSASGECVSCEKGQRLCGDVPTSNAPFPPRHACSSGTWGDKCDKPCPTHCIQYAGRSCNETTGVCLNDCLRGLYGERCDKLCSRSCEDSVCQSASGECVSCEKGQRLCGDVPTSNGAVPISLDRTVGYAFSGLLFVLVTIILIFQCRQHHQYRNRHTSPGETVNPGTSPSYPSGVRYSDVTENHRYWEVDESELEQSEHRMSGAETHRSGHESAATPGYARPREQSIMQNHLIDGNCADTLDKSVPLQSTHEYETVASFDNIVSDSSGMLYLRDDAGDISVRYISAETTM